MIQKFLKIEHIFTSISRLLLISLSSIVFVACSQNKKEISIDVSQLSLSGDSLGGVMVWAINKKGDRFATVVNSGNPDQKISVPLGQWDFYAIGWSGPGHLEGDSLCGHASKELLEDEEQVSIVAKPINCQLANYSKPNMITGNSFKPIRLVTCADFDSVSPFLDCDSSPGGVLSFKVSLLQYGHSDIEEEQIKEGLISQCQTGFSLSQLASQVRIPTGLPANANLYRVKLEVFDSAACSGNAKIYTFKSGQSFNEDQSKLDFSSGSLSVLLADTSGVSPTPTPIVISSAQLALTTTPAASEVAGTNFSLIVEVRDSENNLITTGPDASANVTVTLQSGTGSILGTTTVQASGGIADFSAAGMNIQLAGAKTLLISKEDTSASGGSAVADTTHAFNITHSTSAAISIISEPSSTIAGSELAPVVEILDAYGNRITSGGDETATVTLSKSSGPGTLSGTISKNMVNGIVDFSGNGVYFDLVGAHSLDINALALTTATTSNFTITHGAASQLSFSTQPTDVNTGANISAVVEIQDSFGNLVTTGVDSTANVTLSKFSGPGSFSGTMMEAAVGGVVTFSDNSINSVTAGTYVFLAQKEDLSGSGGASVLNINSLSFDVNVPNAITFGVFGTSSVTDTSFDANVTYTGDGDGDATVDFCYCNESDNPGCNPIAGVCNSMIDGGSDYNISVVGLTAPNDPGDTLNIAINPNDPDGVISPPSNSTVTLALPTPPSVTNVTIAESDGPYGIGSSLTVYVTFDANVFVGSTPRILLETGATDRYANYTSGSGTPTLSFSYTVTANDVSADLDYQSTSALELNGGTINDTFAQAANLILVSPGTAGSIGANKNIVVDGIAPTIPTSLTLVNPVSSPAADDTPEYQVGGVTSGDYIEIHDSGTCTNNVGSLTAAGATVNITTSSLGADGTYALYAKATDPAGNESACSGLLDTYTLDTTSPIAPSLDQVTGNYRTGFTVTFGSSDSDPNFDNYYYTTNNTPPNCGSTPGGSYTVTESTPGTTLVLRVVGCDAAGNLSTETQESYTYILPMMLSKYDNALDWNDYITDPMNLSSAACSGSGACYHGGMERKVEVLGAATCGALGITDSLGVYNWQPCDDGSGTATFYTKGFAPGKSVVDLLDPSAWKNIDVTISGVPSAIGAIISDSVAPYGNPVEDLSGIVATNSTAVISDLSKVYTYSANLDMGGLSIENDKISIVNLGGVANALRLTNGYSGGNNCNYANGGTTTPDAHCMIVAKDRKYLFIHGEILASQGAGVSHYGVHFYNVSHSKVIDSYIHHGEDTAIFLKNSFENEIIGSDIGNFTDTPAAVLGSTYGSAFYLDNADFNRIRGAKIQNIGVYGALLVSGSTNNSFHDINLQNSGDSGLWIENLSHENSFVNITLSNFHDNTNSAGIYVDSSDDLIFSGVTVANSALDGILMYNSQGSIFQHVNFVNNADFGVFIDDFTQGVSFQQLSSVNNGGIGFYSNLADSVFLSDSAFLNNATYGA